MSRLCAQARSAGRVAGSGCGVLAAVLATLICSAGSAAHSAPLRPCAAAFLAALPLRLRGGSRPRAADEQLLQDLAACERGANSITSDCFFESPGRGRRSVHAGTLEALRDFADMPMCNQSLVAFDQRVSARALLAIVRGSGDGTPIEPVGVQALAARCLHKLCKTARATPELASLLRRRKVALDELASVVKQPLQHQDPQIKWHLLDTIGLLARDAEGTALLQRHSVVPTVLRCLWDEDTDVILRTGRVVATLAAARVGITALFSSEALEVLIKALGDNQAHVRSVHLGSKARPLVTRCHWAPPKERQPATAFAMAPCSMPPSLAPLGATRP